MGRILSKDKPFLSQQHWNGQQCCVIDVETTGLSVEYNEIVQVTILPLDGWLRPNIGIGRMPFDIYMMPNHPQNYDEEARKVTGIKLSFLEEHAYSQETGLGMLETWLDKLGLPLNKGGVNRCKILPLGQNYGFDRSFLQAWMGPTYYDEWFHYHYKDTMITAEYLNDRAAMHGEQIPFPKTNLQYLASQLGIESRNAHDSMSDCITTAAVYRKMCLRGAIG